MGVSRKTYRYMHSRQEQISEPPFKVDGDSWLKMKPHTLISIIAGVVAAVVGWTALKSDSQKHTEGIEMLQSRQAVVEKTLIDQHDTLLLLGQQMTNADKKLDFLTGARRERPPAGSSTTIP